MSGPLGSGFGWMGRKLEEALCSVLNIYNVFDCLIHLTFQAVCSSIDVESFLVVCVTHGNPMA